MANISQEVNIEMLEKLADGSYKKKNPQTKASQVIAEDGSNLESHLAESTTIKHKGKEIGLEDTANNFTNKNVEGAMNELFTNVSDGKQLVGGAITGVDDSVVIPTEPSFADLAGAIGGISTGKKWASGFFSTTSNYQTRSVRGLNFRPSIIIIKGVEDKVSRFLIYGEFEKMGSGQGINVMVGTGTPVDGEFIIYFDGFRGTVMLPAEYFWIAFE